MSKAKERSGRIQQEKRLLRSAVRASCVLSKLRVCGLMTELWRVQGDTWRQGW